MEIISREEARAAGQKTYFTGRVCKRGHRAARKIGNGTCVECARMQQRQWRKDNPEAAKEYTRTRYLRQKDVLTARAKKWKEENRERYLENMRRHWHENKAHGKKVAAKWRKNNKAKLCAKAARRNACKKERTPAWADLPSIDMWYQASHILSALLGVRFNVDHVIPLQGERVSGLHTFENLQLLPALENQSKSNRFHVG